MAGGSAETLVMEARCGRNLPGETQEAREGVLKAGGSREKPERRAGRAVPFGRLAPSCVRRRRYARLTALTAGQVGWGQDGGASCTVRTSERT